MTRCDDEDLPDIRFLLQQEPLTAGQLASAFQRARVRNMPEIQQLFLKAQPRVLALAEPLITLEDAALAQSSPAAGFSTMSCLHAMK